MSISQGNMYMIKGKEFASGTYGKIFHGYKCSEKRYGNRDSNGNQDKNGNEENYENEKKREKYAIKRLEGISGRNLIELDIGRRMSHPNIIPFLDFYFSGDYLFIIMPYYELNLTSYASKGLSPKLVKKFTYQLLKAVDYLHSEGIFHSDIKPHNILVSSNEDKIVLIDFGISHYVNTKYYIMQTLNYIAPEIYELHSHCWDKEYEAYRSLGYEYYKERYFDTRVTEMFCVGLVVFYMINGKDLFELYEREKNSVVYFRMRAFVENYKTVIRVRSSYRNIDKYESFLFKILSPKLETRFKTIKEALEHDFLSDVIPHETDKKTYEGKYRKEETYEINGKIYRKKVKETKEEINEKGIGEEKEEANERIESERKEIKEIGQTIEKEIGRIDKELNEIEKMIKEIDIMRGEREETDMKNLIKGINYLIVLCLKRREEIGMTILSIDLLYRCYTIIEENTDLVSMCCYVISDTIWRGMGDYFIIDAETTLLNKYSKKTIESTLKKIIDKLEGKIYRENVFTLASCKQTLEKSLGTFFYPRKFFLTNARELMRKIENEDETKEKENKSDVIKRYKTALIDFLNEE